MSVKELSRGAWISIIISCVVMIKMFISSLTIAESFTFLSILLSVQVAKFVDYKFPERPDLFEEYEKLKSKTESLESDITALKLEKLGRR